MTEPTASRAIQPLKDRKKFETDNWQVKVGGFLESRAAEVTLLLLILFDVCLLATEAGIDHKILCVEGHLETRGAIPHMFRQVTRLNLLHTDAGNSSPGHQEVLVCESPEGHNAQHIMHICHILSVVILILFMVELLLKIWIYGQEFFSSPFEVLDLVVVTVSLACDLVIVELLEQSSELRLTAETVVILLMMLRLWRVVRISHGLYQIKAMEDKRVREQLEEQRTKINTLQGKLKERGIELDFP